MIIRTRISFRGGREGHKVMRKIKRDQKRALKTKLSRIKRINEVTFIWN